MTEVPLPCLDEQTIERMVRGALPPELLPAVEKHLAGCAACIDLVALAASSSEGDGGPRDESAPPAGQALAAGAAFGRYTVLSLTGRGGMAEVYAAYDPELDRKVALKLIHDAEMPGQAARLVREAKALARLSHPNVVTVHEVGTSQGQVFIAMEFVEGQTLARWCEAQKRPWQEILGAFLEAGRGLAAAHEAGLVHRDFKPQNVMVRADGGVRVMDFGLARSVADEAAAAPDGQQAPATPAPGTLDHLTRTGALVGTPLYMAPEQISGGAVSARTDQFAFCVSLYAALTGQHPFGGDRLATLFKNVMAGRLQEPPPSSRVPARLHRALVRGLRPAAEERWPSMDALLAALEHDPARGRKRAAAVAGASILVVAAALAIGRGGSAQRSFCRTVPPLLHSTWESDVDGPVRSAVRATFQRTGRSYAERTFRTVSQLVDTYVAGWMDLYTDACEAKNVRGDQAGEILDFRMECLQGRLQSLRALTEVFLAADASVVENAVGAAAALPPLGRCADVELLREVVKPPSDAPTRTRIGTVRRDVAMMKALSDAGRCTAAAARAEPIIEAARHLGYLPLLAEALDVAGWLGNDCLDARTAARYAREAAGVAEAAHHDELGANAAVLAATMLGERLGEFHDAAEWAERARWKIKRIGGSPLLESWLEVAIGNALALKGRYSESLQAEQKALTLKEKLFGPDHIDVARSLGNVSWVLARLGRSEDALKQGDRAVSIAEPHLGGDHPLLARLQENRGAALLDAGRAGEARETFERALQIWSRSGSDELFAVESLIGVGESDLRAGNAADGIPPLERAVKILETRGGSPALLGAARFALARSLGAGHRQNARARGLATEALHDFTRVPALKDKAAEVERWLATTTTGPSR